MSLLRKAAVFALKELAKPTLTKIGEHIGNSTGRVLARRIDPTSKPADDSEDDDAPA